MTKSEIESIDKIAELSSEIVERLIKGQEPTEVYDQLKKQYGKEIADGMIIILQNFLKQMK